MSVKRVKRKIIVTAAKTIRALGTDDTGIRTGNPAYDAVLDKAEEACNKVKKKIDNMLFGKNTNRNKRTNRI